MVTPELLRSLELNGFSRFSWKNSSDKTLDIAKAIGCVATLPGIQQVQTIIPREKEGIENSSYSGNFGLGEFPMHTDMAHWHTPPRYFILRCIQPTEHVFTSIMRLDELFGPESPITLKKSLFRPRRRLDGRLSMLRLFDGKIHRWDTLFIQPMNNIARDLESRILDRILNSQAINLILNEPNECILIDNWKTIHGRSAIPENGRNRVVERIYLSSIKGISNDTNNP